MPIPSSAKTFTEEMDPNEVKDFTTGISQGADVTDLLDPGESVQTFTLIPQQEATDAGFRIKSGSGYPVPTFVGLNLTFWCEIADGFKTRDEWFGGERMALELTIVTNNSPPRIRQRTFAITVKQQ